MAEDWEQQMLDMDNGGMVEIVPGMNVPKPDGDLGGEANQTSLLQPQLYYNHCLKQFLRRKDVDVHKEMSLRLMDSRKMLILWRLIKMLVTVEIVISLMMH